MPQKPTFQDFVSIPLNLFGAVGIRLIWWDSAEKLTRRDWLGFVFIGTNFTLNFLAKIQFLIFEDLPTPLDVTALVVYWSFAINACTKALAVWVVRKKLDSVLKQMLKRFPKTQRLRDDYRVEEYSRKIHRYCKYLTIYHLCTTSMFNWLPVLQSLLKYYVYPEHPENAQFEYNFPYKMAYPWNERRAWGYGIAYVSQVLGAYTASCFFLGADLLLISVINLTNMHFEYLTKQILQFKPTGTDDDIRVMGKMFSYHDEILRYSEILDQCFSLSILMNYIASCVVICMLAFQVVAGTGFLDLIKFLAFLISTLVHVYFISLFGSEMIELSTGISDAFCQHQWYEGNGKYLRLFPLPIARAQRSAHLTAFKFFEISMESFKSLMTTSYQFFTLIRTRFEEEN